MALHTRTCSETIGGGKRLCCACGSRPYHQISPEVTVKGFKMCSIFEVMDGKEDVKEDGNTGSEHETQNGNCEDTEAAISNRNDEHSETGEAE
jgi:hypothetical protein